MKQLYGKSADNGGTAASSLASQRELKKVDATESASFASHCSNGTWVTMSGRGGRHSYGGISKCPSPLSWHLAASWGWSERTQGGVPASLKPLVEQERVNNGPWPVDPLEGVPHKWAECRALTGTQHKLAARLEHAFSTITH